MPNMMRVFMFTAYELRKWIYCIWKQIKDHPQP